MDALDRRLTATLAEGPIQIEPSEKHVVEYLADMYAAITAIEKLERANNRDLVTPIEHEEGLQRLIRRFDTVDSQLKATHQARYRGYRYFMEEYDMTASCAAAASRLTAIMDQRTKDAATAQAQALAAQEPTLNPQEILEATQHFITAMDSLKLNQTAADQLHPLVVDLISAVRRVAPNFDQLPRLENWLSRLDNMHASDTLDDRETREMLFDLDRGYQAFHRHLGDSR
jgi:ESCRT-I complex subunit VPS28